MRAKRRALVLDESLLEHALRLSGEPTWAGKIIDLAGSGLWEGDLAALRGDAQKAR